MDRQIVYTGAIPLSTDLLNTQKNAYTGLLKLAAGILGTSALINGLNCIPTTPASLSIIVAPGELYSLQTLDPTPYSDLGADSHTVLKQGIANDPTILTLQQPGTIGYSVNYLIEAAFSESDAIQVVLPYYNSTDPASPYSGPSGSGASQNTARLDTVVIQAKAGVAAPTDSQTTPAADPGWVALWSVQVDYGQTAINSGHIVQISGAPFITETLTQKISKATADLRYVQLAALSLIGAAGQVPQGNPSGQLDPSWLTSFFPYLNRHFPEILTSNKLLYMTPGSGHTIVIAANQGFLFRDSVLFGTGAGWTSPATAANKTYHLRFVFMTNAGRSNMGASFYGAKSISDGSFYMIDVTDAQYNPTALAENDPGLDSMFDDMLIAKVVTNSGNSPTISALANASRLFDNTIVSGVLTNSSDWTIWPGVSLALNWAREPLICVPSLSGICSESTDPRSSQLDPLSGIGAIGMLFVRVTANSLSRYGATLDYAYDDIDTHNYGFANVNCISEA